MTRYVPDAVLQRALSFGENELAPAGPLSLRGLAELYLLYCDRVAQHGVQSDTANRLFWTWECLQPLTGQDPELAWRVICHCLELLTTVEQAGQLAAGPLEDLIAFHGETVIARIEAMAHGSARFRFVLNGVWSQGNEDTNVWQRVTRARRTGPLMTDPHGLPAA